MSSLQGSCPTSNSHQPPKQGPVLHSLCQPLSVCTVCVQCLCAFGPFCTSFSVSLTHSHSFSLLLCFLLLLRPGKHGDTCRIHGRPEEGVLCQHHSPLLRHLLRRSYLPRLHSNALKGQGRGTEGKCPLEYAHTSLDGGICVAQEGGSGCGGSVQCQLLQSGGADTQTVPGSCCTCQVFIVIGNHWPVSKCWLHVKCIATSDMSVTWSLNLWLGVFRLTGYGRNTGDHVGSARGGEQ